MRHHNSNRKFGRANDARRALLRSLAGNLIVHEKIVTTEAKAKELKSFVEKIITKGKDDSVSSRRLVTQDLIVPKYADKIIKVISPKYKDRKGGYTRIVKLGARGGDGSKMAIIEFV